MRQKWHIADDRDFQSTPNTRNEMMLTEAGEFAAHLKRCEKDIRTLKNATEGGCGRGCCCKSAGAGAVAGGCAG